MHCLRHACSPAGAAGRATIAPGQRGTQRLRDSFVPEAIWLRSERAPTLQWLDVMQPFPHRYQVRVLGENAHARLESGERPSLVGGAPPEFDGDPTVWSPEQLLLSAVGLCLYTTFRAFAARGGASPLTCSFQDQIEGVLAKTASGPRFVEITHHVELGVKAEDRERAERTLQSAERHCIIANSLNVPVRVIGNVKVVDQSAA
jgi:organic hydroperoxide reductase OsmC/OhrA